ncbi:hypothetical protein EL09_15400 [Salmonella enterica subsp. enterica]|nr:hypothetical protein [Salmonella enterica subsp. enterica]MIF51100.1 hypothetical protein [Salmonella enterica subsp. enterica]
MGLDITLYSRNRDTGRDNIIGCFRKVNALLNWVHIHVSPVKNNTMIELTESHLRLLKENLQQLTPENCHELYPAVDGFFFGSTDYADMYWYDVADVLSWVEETLNNPVLHERTILFSASW